GANTFQVNASGNLVKVNSIGYSWPSAQGTASTILTNDGSGTLSWAAGGGGGGGASISAGDSNVMVTDTGDGYITFVEDSNEIMRISGSSVTMTNRVTVGTITAGQSGYTGGLQNPGGGNWSKYNTITITAGTDALPVGYTHKIYFDGTTIPSASIIFNSPCQSSGNDFRVEYWNGGSWIELDRDIVTFSATTIDVRFRLQAVIGANTNSGTTYRMVYNNPVSGVGLNNRDNIYLFWDDFNTGTLAKWTNNLGASIVNYGGNNVVRLNGFVNCFITATINVPNNVKVDWRYRLNANSNSRTSSAMFIQDTANEVAGYWGEWSWEPYYSWGFWKKANGVTEGSPNYWFAKSLKTIGTWYTAAFSRHNTTLRFFDIDSTQRATWELIAGELTNNITALRLTGNDNSDTYIDDVYLRSYVNSDANITVVAGTETSFGTGDTGSGSVLVNAGGTGTALVINQTGTGKIVDLQKSAVSKFVILDSGNVGIGTTDPGTYKCYINGTGYLNSSAWVYASDIRLKENISYIQSGLNVIEQLKPVKFDYINGEKKQVGFIAQDVQKTLPDIVTEGANGMLGMKTDAIIPYLVKAIKELKQENEALKVRIFKLESK
ncbi:MAG: tail fiber domain-containing protein, partial [Bacteroidota bacterium]